MEAFKSLTPAFRKKLNLGLLIFAGLQFAAMFGLQIFRDHSSPARHRAHEASRAIASVAPPAVPVARAAVVKKVKPAAIPAVAMKKHVASKRPSKPAHIAKRKPVKKIKARQARALPPFKALRRVSMSRSPMGQQKLAP